MLSLCVVVHVLLRGLLTSSTGNPGGRKAISLLACLFNEKGRGKRPHILSKWESEESSSPLPASFETYGVCGLKIASFATICQISVTCVAYNVQCTMALFNRFTTSCQFRDKRTSPIFI